MLIGDPFDFRPGAPDEAPDMAAPALGPAPDPLSREPRNRVGWRRRLPGVGTSLVFHAVVVVLFLIVWRSMVRDVSAPEAISVEIVHAIPGETPPPPKPEPAPPPPPPPPPSPPPAAQPIADPAPPHPPEPPSAEQALKAALREPPPEPKAAAAQRAVNQKGTASTLPEKPAEASKGVAAAPPVAPEQPAAAPAMPTVLTAPESASSVPAPAPKPETPKPPAPGDPSQTAPKASDQLAAALATDAMPMPLSFRAALSARGTSDDADYRGSVFGALARAQQAVNDTARARHLKGQAVIAIVLTDTGAIASATIVQSSGHADSDAFALDMVRRAAPYPPPPPGASRTFTPAIAFGNG